MDVRAIPSNRPDMPKVLFRRRLSFVRRTKIGNRPPISGSRLMTASVTPPRWVTPPHPAKTGRKPPDGTASPATVRWRPGLNARPEEHYGVRRPHCFEAAATGQNCFVLVLTLK